MRFKNYEGKSERESPKRTISASSRLGPLQMVSESHWVMCQRGGCSPKEVDTRRCASKDAGPEGGRHEVVCQQRRWSRRGVDLVGVPHRLGGERNTLYKGVETSP